MRKRQMTMAKRAREQAVKEKRALKAEKKQAARDAKLGIGVGEDVELEGGEEASGEGLESEPTTQEDEEERPHAAAPDAP